MRAGLTSVDGVKAVEVSLENGTATVLCDPTVQPEQLLRAVEEAGYGATLPEKDSS